MDLRLWSNQYRLTMLINSGVTSWVNIAYNTLFCIQLYNSLILSYLYNLCLLICFMLNSIYLIINTLTLFQALFPLGLQPQRYSTVSILTDYT